MKSCAFFGHRDYVYETEKGNIEECIVRLLEEEGVTEFYSGYRGNFDVTCCDIVCKLQAKYPQIKLMLVLAYRPEAGLVLPSVFDGSVYLLERDVPRRYAIIETNKCLVDRNDFILSGVVYKLGGAYKAVEYAKKHKKNVLYLKPK